MQDGNLESPAYSLGAVLLLICVWAICVWGTLTLLEVLPWRVRYWSDMRAGNAIIAKVEQFRGDHGRLPNRDNIDEVNALGFTFPVDYSPDYRAFGDEYEIEYMEGFDGPYIAYSSKLKEWQCRPVGHHGGC